MQLRDRLESLRATTPQRERLRPVKPAPLTYLLPIENHHGLTYYNDSVHVDHHGQIDLKNYPEIPAEMIRFLSLDSSIRDFAIQDAVFLDIETTGTAGGTGTYAFLTGLGFVDKGYFQIRQYFLHDLAQEAPYLHEIAEFCSRFRSLITYNGKCFDSQILRNRYLMHRREDPLAGKQHIDMLFVARRLWKRRLQECELTNLERNILDFHRVEDIPSYLIPGAYTDYLRYANASMIQKVLEHNRWDILSLAVLTARAALLPDQPDDLTPEEHFSLGLLHARHKNYQSAVEHQIRAVRDGCRSPQPVLLALARNLRRVRDHDQMRWLIAQAQEDVCDGEVIRRLCILCEHDLKDYHLALELIEVQLHKLEKYRGLTTRFIALTREWVRRRDRVVKKIELTTKTQRRKESRKLLFNSSL